MTAQIERPGFRAVKCDLEPPTVAPYRWSAEQEAGSGLVLRGSYPGADARGQILAAARQAFGAGAAIRDEMKPALGAPSAFIAKVTRALTDLTRLRQGRVEINDDSYVLAGKGPETYEACQALRLQIAQLDGPDSVAQAVIECPRRRRPCRWSFRFPRCRGWFSMMCCRSRRGRKVL